MPAFHKREQPLRPAGRRRAVRLISFRSTKQRRQFVIGCGDFSIVESFRLFSLARWSEDVSEDVAAEIRRRCDLQIRELPSTISDFVERYETSDRRQLTFRLM